MFIFYVSILCLLHSTRCGFVDDAKQQVNDLRIIIRSAIITSFNDLDDILNDVLAYRNNLMTQIKAEFALESSTIDSQLSKLDDIGASAGVDVSSCTEPGKNTLQGIGQYLQEQLQACEVSARAQSKELQNSAVYLMEVIINDVELLDYQIDLCGENLECISPILQRIELAHVQLIERIGVELEATENLAKELRVVFANCAQSSESEAISQSNRIVDNAKACTNDLIDSSF